MEVPLCQIPAAETSPCLVSALEPEMPTRRKEKATIWFCRMYPQDYIIDKTNTFYTFTITKEKAKLSKNLYLDLSYSYRNEH